MLVISQTKNTSLIHTLSTILRLTYTLSIMHFIASLVAVGSVATLASASVGFQFPDSVPLSKRQVSGPAYECHANCGMYQLFS